MALHAASSTQQPTQFQQQSHTDNLLGALQLPFAPLGQSLAAVYGRSQSDAAAAGAEADVDQAQGGGGGDDAVGDVVGAAAVSLELALKVSK